MAGGSFCERLTDWIRSEYPADLARVLLFVPTARVAVQVRARLATDYNGVLPTIMPLVGSDSLAELLGLDVAQAVPVSAARVEIFRILQSMAERSVGGTERQWRQVDSLCGMLNRLALYGVGMEDLREGLPGFLVGAWEIQAEVLLAVSAHMDNWLAERGEVWCGARERMILEEAAVRLATGQDGWIPVVAGVVDAIPAGVALARVAGERGAVIVPRFVGGEVSANLTEAWEERVGPVVPLDVDGDAVLTEVVAETDWDEARLAALEVKRALARGRSKVAVVGPSRTLRRRVGAMLEAWGIAVCVGGDETLDRTPDGRWALSVEWLRGGTPKDYLAAMAQDARCEALLPALAELAGFDVWLEHEDWRELMALTLAGVDAVREVKAQVNLLGPQEARLAEFDAVVVLGVVEGVWPAMSQDAWLSEAHLRALGMPDMERRALLAGTELESLLGGGNAETLVIRTHTVGGKEVVASRFLAPFRARLQAERELPAVLETLRETMPERMESLGVFVPEGEMWPARWSASMVEDMLACPYKAMARRMLDLHVMDPLIAVPDARQGGLLVHRWLERIGVRRQASGVREETFDGMVADMLADAWVELRKENPVMRAIWGPKFKKLAPALAAKWLADGRSVAAVEKKVSVAVGAEVGTVTFTAKIDRVERGDGGLVVLDYKTGTPPSMGKVANGERPQVALEAWLMGLADEVVSEVEFWHLRGYGTTPLSVVRSGGKTSMEVLLAPVAEGVAQLAETFAEGKAWPAVPHLAGGGLLATGHCERCDLAGVCRRKASGYQASGVRDLEV